MKLDTNVQFIQEGKKTSDGMGGWIDGGAPVVVATQMAHVAPIKAERLLKEYGIVSTSARHIIFKHPFLPPLGFDYLLIDGRKFSVVESYTNKYTIMLAQEI